MVSTSRTNKPINPRGNDQSPLAYNKAAIYSGKALDFDGVNDVINITTDDLDFGANDFSVSAIVDWSGTHADGKLAYAERGSSSSQLAAWQIRTDGSGNMLLQANTAADGWQAVTFSGVEAIIANTLTHLAFVRVGTGVTLYINGQFYSTGTGSIQATLDTPNGAFAIGNRIGANNYWNGLVSNFKVFSVALTAAQVADLYNNPEKVVPTGVDNTALKLWLPMQEGAGTTAYDGSGNGNHGTISGATYVHGIGAPVAQTAVISWNKGVNNIGDHAWDASAVSNNSSISTSSHSAPNGVETAFIFDDGTANTYHRSYKQASCSAGEVTASVFVKKKDVDYINVALGVDGGSTKDFALVDLVNGTINDTSGNPTATSIQSVGDGWYYVSVQETHASGNVIIYIYGQDPTNGSSIDDNYTGANNQTYIWGASVKDGAINNVFIPTYGSVQTSPVLLPQGLTTGRDITGVNLFENVRKQGALNLDGNSWAEVHDNESLDFGTGSFTIEAWARVKFVAQGSSYNVVMTLGGNLSSQGTSGFIINSSKVPVYIYSNNLSGTGSISEGTWIHMVGVYNETNATIYVNGSQVDQDARTAASITNTLVKQIGRDSTTTRYYNDQIAQPRIYNRALTASEIERNYNAGKNTYTN